MKKQILLFIFILPVYCTHCQVMKLTSGVTVYFDFGPLVTFDNLNLDSDGIIDGLGQRLVFSGNQNTSIFLSNPNLGTTDLEQIEIAKTGGAELLLMSKIIITQGVFFTSGLLNLNNNILKLTTFTALSNESEASHVYGPNGGYVEITASYFFAPNTPMNPGNLGLIISAPQTGGSVIIRRGHQSQPVTAGGKSVQRYYDVIQNVNHPVNPSFQFTYYDAELNGLDESNLVMWKSSNNINWTNQGYTSRSAIDNYVTNSGLDFSRWTLSTPLGARPARSVNGREITPKLPVNEIDAKDIWKTWPNPVNKILWIDITATGQSKATTSLFDSKGALIRTQQNHLVPGSNLLTIDTKDLPAGIYYIRTQWGDGQTKRSAMFMKQ